LADSRSQEQAQDAPAAEHKARATEPRWPAVLAIVALCGFEFALPKGFTFGQPWLLTAISGALLLPLIASRRAGYHALNQYCAYALNTVVTASLIGSLYLLVRALLSHGVPPKTLLGVAVVLWLSNVLVFASWYWRLDAGGPHARDLRDAHTEGAFLFPQMTIDSLKTPEGARGWMPGFVDYLFLAFNSSTAFSPTDVPVLSRWAKLLMMVQATISLITIALLAARAVNIL
jgi:hypothetical protein